MKRTFPYWKALYIESMCALLIISLFFCMTKGANGQSSTKLYVDPPNIEYLIPAFHETFMVNVSIADVSDLQSFEFKLYWNTTLLDLKEVQFHDFLKHIWVNVKNEINEPLGRYWVNVTSLADPPGANGTGSLVTLTFNMTHEPAWPKNVSCALDLADTRLLDSSGDLILHDVYDGEYWCYSFPALSISTTTDKASYLLQESVYISGNLTLGFSSVQDGLVALEVDNPDNEVMVIRTLSTGIAPANQTVEIIDVFSCGGPPNYLPRNSFFVGETVYFNVSVRNNDNESRYVFITLNLYDVNSIPLGKGYFNVPVAAGKTGWVLVGISIPDTASVGEARGYASALTGWPKAGGTAYCPEKMDTIQIQGGGGLGGASTSSSGNPEGTFNLTFTLPSNEKSGIYTIYASSDYTIYERYQKTTDQATFLVTGLGPWDVNGDGVVDIMDVLIVGLAFGSRPGDPNWNPIADLAEEWGLIDIMDVLVVALHFGEGG